MNRLIKYYITCLFAVTIFVGCSKTLDFKWVIYNSGKTEITNAHISYDKFKSVGGIIIPNSTKTHSVDNRKIPEEATIKWNSNSGEKFIKKIKLSEILPKNIESGSELTFEINNKNEVLFYVKPPFKY